MMGCNCMTDLKSTVDRLLSKSLLSTTYACLKPWLTHQINFQSVFNELGGRLNFNHNFCAMQEASPDPSPVHHLWYLMHYSFEPYIKFGKMGRPAIASELMVCALRLLNSEPLIMQMSSFLLATAQRGSSKPFNEFASLTEYEALATLILIAGS